MATPTTTSRATEHGERARRRSTSAPNGSVIPLPRATRARRVLIVGAGMSGLVAGYELRAAGHDVTILEGRAEVGGRVRTIRGLEGGLYAEAGATFVPAHHALTMHYVEKLGITLTPVPSLPAASFMQSAGRTLRFDRTPWPFDLSARERRLGPVGAMFAAVEKDLARLGDPRAKRWPPRELAALDDMSFAELLRRRGLSDDMQRLVHATFVRLLGDDIEALSALFVLRDLALQSGGGGASVIRGGSSLLPLALAQRLEGAIRLEHEVQRIDVTDDGVRVSCRVGRRGRAGDRTVTLSGDCALVTLPFSVARDIDFRPRLTGPLAAAMAEMPYTAVTRVWLTTRERAWPRPESHTSEWTDLPVGWVRESGFNQPGPIGIVEAYMTGAPARTVSRLSPAERLAWTARGLRRTRFARVASVAIGGASHAWHDDPWARGAYGWATRGQMTRNAVHAIVDTPGRLHFAGEHLSSWPSWMQGAIESGLRAARRIGRG